MGRDRTSNTPPSIIAPHVAEPLSSEASPSALRVAFDALGPATAKTGTGTYTIELVRALAGREGLELHVLTNGRLGEALQGLPGVHVHTIGAWGTTRASRILWEQIRLPAWLRAHRIDVLHGAGHVLPLRKTVPTVLTIYDLTYWTHPDVHTWMRRTYMRALIPPSLERADAVIAISRSTAADLTTVLQVPESRIRTIPLAAAPWLRPASRDEQAAVRARYGLNKDYVLFVGTLEPRKNLQRLLEGFSRAGGGTELVLVGLKGWKLQLEELLSRHGLQGRVRPLGHVPDGDLPGLYSAATVFAYPSLYEGFGLPVLEAMACGCPVLTSTTSSLPEVAGEAAVLVDPADTDAVAAGLSRLLGDAGLRERLRSAGEARARDFSWEAAARATLETYREARSRRLADGLR